MERAAETTGADADVITPVEAGTLVDHEEIAGRLRSREGRDDAMSDTRTLNVGDLAPDFTLRSIGLKEVSLKDYRGKNVVLLFYPLDWTPG